MRVRADRIDGVYGVFADAPFGRRRYHVVAKIVAQVPVRVSRPPEIRILEADLPEWKDHVVRKAVCPSNGRFVGPLLFALVEVCGEERPDGRYRRQRQESQLQRAKREALQVALERHVWRKWVGLLAQGRKQ